MKCWEQGRTGVLAEGRDFVSHTSWVQGPRPWERCFPSASCFLAALRFASARGSVLAILQRGKQAQRLDYMPKVWQLGIWRTWVSSPEVSDVHILSSTFCCLPYKNPFLNGSSFKSLPDGQMHLNDFYIPSEAPVTTAVPHSIPTIASLQTFGKGSIPPACRKQSCLFCLRFCLSAARHSGRQAKGLLCCLSGEAQASFAVYTATS